jgi:hypothetical protein
MKMEILSEKHWISLVIFVNSILNISTMKLADEKFQIQYPEPFIYKYEKQNRKFIQGNYYTQKIFLMNRKAIKECNQILKKSML